MAMGAFFVAMAAGSSFLYNEYTAAPADTGGMQNFITQITYFCDKDGDTYYTSSPQNNHSSCSSSQQPNMGDCNDTNASINP